MPVLRYNRSTAKESAPADKKESPDVLEFHCANFYFRGRTVRNQKSLYAENMQATAKLMEKYCFG